METVWGAGGESFRPSGLLGVVLGVGERGEVNGVSRSEGAGRSMPLHKVSEVEEGYRLWRALEVMWGILNWTFCWMRSRWRFWRVAEQTTVSKFLSYWYQQALHAAEASVWVSQWVNQRIGGVQKMFLSFFGHRLQLVETLVVMLFTCPERYDGKHRGFMFSRLVQGCTREIGDHYIVLII